ncbi:MAG: hypothetical protein AVDCRST_MAG25-456, partial [uncultured Rubrobacteraceae bacterium]
GYEDEDEGLAGAHLRLARLGAEEQAEQGAVSRLGPPRALHHGGLCVGDGRPGPGRRVPVPAPVLGLGAVRHRDPARHGRVQDEPSAQGTGAGPVLYPALYRFAPHHHPRAQPVPVPRRL